MEAAPPLNSEILLKHVGHEMKFFAYSVVEFRRQRGKSSLEVPLQDSALVRARTLIDFFAGSGQEGVYYISDVYEPKELKHPPGLQREAHMWMRFISGRQSHIGHNREASSYDRWPHVTRGARKDPDRLEHLAAFIIRLIRSRLDAVPSDCRSVLELIAVRASDYLAEPTRDQFHAMDPRNIGSACGIALT